MTRLYPRRLRQRPAAAPRLRRADAELTREGFWAFRPWRAAAHLRDPLMARSVLSAIDRQVCGFKRRLAARLKGTTGESRAQAKKKPISTAACRHAGEQVKRATVFPG
jgi:hypothetical protein